MVPCMRAQTSGSISSMRFDDRRGARVRGARLRLFVVAECEDPEGENLIDFGGVVAGHRFRGDLRVVVEIVGDRERHGVVGADKHWEGAVVHTAVHGLPRVIGWIEKRRNTASSTASMM